MFAAEFERERLEDMINKNSGNAFVKQGELASYTLEGTRNNTRPNKGTADIIVLSSKARACHF